MRRTVCNLSVRKNLSRLNGVAVTDFHEDADLLCQNIESEIPVRTHSDIPKAAERTGRRIIGVVAIATDVGVLVDSMDLRNGYRHAPEPVRKRDA